MHPRVRRTFVAAIAAIALCPPVPAADALVVERTDGQIDPLASSLKALSLPLEQKAGIPLSTRLRVGYDDGGLWASFECEDTRLSAAITATEQPLSGEDQARLTLTSPAGETVVVTLSGLGQVRAERVGGGALSAEETASIQGGAVVLGDGAMFVAGRPNQERLEAWIGSIHVPWTLLGATGPGEGWTASFARSDFDSGTEALWRWSPDGGPLRFE